MSAVAILGATGPLTMTSREIAELTGKEHKNVLADIRKMLDDLGDTSADFSADLPDSYGRPQAGFRLPKRETLILVSGYSVAMRAKIIDRWQELEAQPRALDPANLSKLEILQMAIQSEQERERLVGEKAKVDAALAVAAPKAAALDRIAEVVDGSFCLTDAAKDLQVAPRLFTRKLQEMGWIYRRPQGGGWLAYQHRITQGVVEHKVTTGEKSDGTEWLSTQVRVTARGMAKLAEIFEREVAAA